MMGFKAAFLRFPEQRFAVVATCNLGSIEPMGLAQRVADIYLADELAPAQPPAGRGGRGGGRGARSGQASPSLSPDAATR